MNICFKKCFKSLFSPLQCIKQSQKCKKRSVFLILYFGRHANEKSAIAPLPPPWLRYCVASNLSNTRDRKKTSQLEQPYFLQISSLFLSAFVSSLLNNKEFMFKQVKISCKIEAQRSSEALKLQQFDRLNFTCINLASERSG